MNLVIEFLLAVALGALHGVPVSFPSLWALQPLALAWLFWRVDQATPQRAAWLGWLFGCSWLVSSVWWLFISMHFYGDLPAWAAAGAVWALCAALSLYLALAMGLFARWRRGRFGADAALITALWLLAELARCLILTGFPWAASGYAHVDSPLAFLAPWLGVYGVGACAAGGVAILVFQRSVAMPLRTRCLAVGALLGAVLLASRGVPHEFTQPAGEVSVALLQNNVPQEQKFSPDHLGRVLEWTRDKLMTLPVDLVVAPETVVPLLPDDVPDDFWEPLRSYFASPGRHAIVGLPLGDFEKGFTNSAAGLSSQTLAMPEGFYRYDKHHLVPFGEFIPTGFRWFTNLMGIPLGDFRRGPLKAPSFRVETAASVQWVAPNICYEDLFGEELAARFIAPQPPTILANLSNMAWFGNTIAIRQHLQISRMRSLELQRPMIRATNTGATALIDHQGHVSSQLPAYTTGVLAGLVQGREGITPFAWWAGRWGLWPLLALGVLMVVVSRRWGHTGTGSVGVAAAG